jgi:hypothetical protein
MLNVFTEAPRELLAAMCDAVGAGSYSDWELHEDGSFRYRGAMGRWRNAGKLVPKRYPYGVTLLYCGLRKKSLRAELSLRAKLHGQMLEILAKDFLGNYSYIVFEPKPLST